MNYYLELVTPPLIEPVSLAEMKVHLRAYSGTTNEDDYISSLITAAREFAEDNSGRSLIDQTWRMTFGDSVGNSSGIYDTVSGGGTSGIGRSSPRKIVLARGPIIAITSIASIASNGDETILDPSGYQLQGQAAKYPTVYAIGNTNWSTGTWRILYRAGYADQTGSPQTGPEVVPERYKLAMKLWAEAMYDRDEKIMALLLRAAERVLKAERSNSGLA